MTDLIERISAMKNRITGACVALTLGFCNVSAQAAGLWLYEQGTPDVGTASAGMTSRAQDADRKSVV